MKRAAVPLALIAVLAISRAAALPEQPLRLSFVGDLMAHNVNYETLDFGRIYDGIKDVFLSDDLSFANLELVVDPSRPRSTYPRFNNHPDYVQAAIDAGLDVFSLANNHSFDYGPQGARATLRSLAEMARRAAAGGRTVAFGGLRSSASETFAPVEIRARGWRIGYLAVTQFSNEWVTEPLLSMADYNNAAQADALVRQVAEAAPAFDLFIVSYHGDNEYVSEPAPAKRRLFHALLDAGAHIVYGHHPHILQPCELSGSPGERKLILYSAGNFVTGQSVRAEAQDPDGMWARTGDSMVYRVMVEAGRRGPSVRAVDLVPAYHHRSPGGGQIIVNSLQTLAHRRTEWSDFYRDRLAILKGYGSENPWRERRNLAP